MSQKSLVIIDGQTLYAKRFSDWMNHFCAKEWVCFVVNSKKELLQLQSKVELHLILIDEKMAQEFEDVWDDSCMMITESKREDVLSLFRYAGMQNIKKELSKRVGVNEQDTDLHDLNTELEGVFRTRLLIPTLDSKELRETIVNMVLEDSKTMMWFWTVGSDCAYDDSSEQFAYDLKMKRELRIGQEKGCNVIYPIRTPFDYREFQREDLEWLFIQLKENGMRQCIVYLDVGLIKNEDMLNCFDEIWVAQAGNEYQNRSASVRSFLQDSNVIAQRVKEVNFAMLKDIFYDR